MRKLLVALATFALLGAACASDSSTVTPSSGGSGSATADACAKDSLPLVNDGTLTVGTDNPAFPPWVLKNDPPVARATSRPSRTTSPIAWASRRTR